MIKHNTRQAICFIMNKKMKIFDCFSVGLLWALSVNAVIIFFLAMSNGGVTQVTINQYGEQWIEVVLFPVILIMGAASLMRLVHKVG